MTLNSFYKNTIRFRKTNANFCDITKSTKEMITNSRNFNSYIKDYVKIIQIPSYKKPEIINYPLLKNHSMISLTSKQFPSENIKGKDKDKRPITTIKFRGPSSIEFHKPSRNDSTNREASINKMIHSFSATTIDKEEDKRKCFINAFLPDYSINNLIYDENEIFHRDKFYDNYIKSRVQYMKNNKLHNNTSNVTIIFNKNTSKEIELELSSMKIEFKRISMTKNEKKTIHLPFDLLFLFYYKGIEYFQHILLTMIKFNVENDHIDIDEEQFYSILKTNLSLLNVDNSSSNDDKNDTNLKGLLYQINEDGHNQNSNSNTNNIERGESMNNNYNHNGNENQLQPHRVISQINQTYRSPLLNDTVKQKLQSNNIKILNKKSYNSYSFIWLTKHETYQISIALPELHLLLTKTQREVFRYIDRNLILFLLEKKFLNWDFYVINYLFSLKRFRFFIDSILTKRTLINHVKINIVKESHGRTFLVKKDVHLSPKKEHVYSLQDYTFSYFYTNDKGKNSYYILHSYTAKVRCEKIDKKKIWVFDFTFKQMLILNSILMHNNNLEAFIMKILITDFANGLIEIDYAFFDHFDKNIFSSDEEIRRGINENEEKIKQTQTHIKGIEIIIKQPYLIRILPESPCCNNSNSNEGRIIHKDILCLFEGLDINQWPKILMNPDLNKRCSIDMNNGSPLRKNKKLTHICPSPDGLNKKRSSTAAFAIQMFKHSPTLSKNYNMNL